MPTVAETEIANTTEVGPLTSQLFDHKSEVSTNPLDVLAASGSRRRRRSDELIAMLLVDQHLNDGSKKREAQHNA